MIPAPVLLFAILFLSACAASRDAPPPAPVIAVEPAPSVSVDILPLTADQRNMLDR